jgi:hypothetical protein
MTIVLFTRFKSGIEDIYLINSGTTFTILKDKKYFSILKMGEINANIISDSTKLIEGFERASKLLSGETTIIIHKALFSSKSRRNLLNFKDISQNRYYIKIIEKIVLSIYVLLK